MHALRLNDESEKLPDGLLPEGKPRCENKIVITPIEENGAREGARRRPFSVPSYSVLGRVFNAVINEMPWHACPTQTGSVGSRSRPPSLHMAFIIFINILLAGATSGVGIGPRHVDLVESLQLRNTTYSGLTLIQGFGSITPAVFLAGDSRDVRLPSSVQQMAADLLTGTKEFTVMATLQQEERNVGTIFAFTKGQQRYFELQSSGRKDEIRLHYIHEGRIHVEVFPYKLADQRWHRLAVMISGTQLEVWVDCVRLYKRTAPSPLTNFTLLDSLPPPMDYPEAGGPPADDSASSTVTSNYPMTLFLGQRSQKHFLFKGALQEVRVVRGPAGHLLQCPHAEATCPTCGGFQHLTEQVEALQATVLRLRDQMSRTEERLRTLEDCDCQKSCRVNDTVRQDGATWKSGCEICTCRKGEISCRPVPCPALTCKKPVYTEGQCCPVCLKQCSLKGVVYDHGETVSPRQCVDCECQNGKMQCRKIEPVTACPKLSCPEHEQFSVPGECCKFCSGTDYCSRGNNCNANATCINLQTKYACHCNKGFIGDGVDCQDINECDSVGAHHGHYCQAHTKCKNTIGGYECECVEGYKRKDEFTCQERDECQEGSHECHQNAQCVNTNGSYKCICSPGYEGDGKKCIPVCNDTCYNGGICVAPDVCECRLGFTGKSCELDVDECALKLHKCHQNSVCINLHGWYTCQCSSGYSAIQNNDLCHDIDECQLGTHTCHSSATCVNTKGSFNCLCPNSTNCVKSCVVNKEEFPDQSVWTPDNSQCSECSCSEGKVVCNHVTCDCSDPNVNRTCCPNCDLSSSCTYPHGSKTSFKNGQTWMHECQTCECLFGEVDCWPIECPPLNCPKPIRLSGDCCARCPDDPCVSPSVNSLNYTLLGKSQTEQPCHFYPIGYALQLQSSVFTQSVGYKCQMPYCSELKSPKGSGATHRLDPVIATAIAFLWAVYFINLLPQVSRVSSTSLNIKKFSQFLLSARKMHHRIAFLWSCLHIFYQRLSSSQSNILSSKGTNKFHSLRVKICKIESLKLVISNKVPLDWRSKYRKRKPRRLKATIICLNKVFTFDYQRPSDMLNRLQ